MDDATYIRPSALRPPTAWLIPRVSTRETPEGFTETVTTFIATDDEAIRLVAEKIISDLKPPARAEPPKIVAAQLVAHCTLYGEPLPDIVLRALAAAMSLNRTVPPRDWSGVDEVVEAARRATAVVPVARRYRAVVLDIVRWLTERGLVLPGTVFHYVITALGLADGRGGLRQKVLEAVLPAPRPEQRLVGVAVDGDGEAVALWRERSPEPRVGTRLPELCLKAVEAEAEARAARGRWGKPALTYQELADRVGTDFNTIRTWAVTSQWRMAVLSRAYWLVQQRSRTADSV